MNGGSPEKDFRCCDNCERDKLSNLLSQVPDWDIKFPVLFSGSDIRNVRTYLESLNFPRIDEVCALIIQVGYFAEVDLTFEAVLALKAFLEFNGVQPTSVVIDIIRGADNKRSSHVQLTASIIDIKGRGSKRSYTWWFEFIHGPLSDHEYLIGMTEPL